jgi:hypothetical protein
MSVDTTRNPNTLGSGGGLLIESTFKASDQSLVYRYEYNGSKALIRAQMDAAIGAINVKAVWDIQRNSSGLVTSSRIIGSNNGSTDIDTMVFIVGRNANGKIAYFLFKDAENAPTGEYDSIVYRYNAAGKVAGLLGFERNANSNIAEPYILIEFTYSGNNMTKSEQYDLNGSLSARTLELTSTFTYDKNPGVRAVQDDEAFIFMSINPIPGSDLSANNIVKQVDEYPNDPDENETTEYKYVYNADGRPASADVTITKPSLPASKGTFTFKYQ